MAKKTNNKINQEIRILTVGFELILKTIDIKVFYGIIAKLFITENFLKEKKTVKVYK